MKFFVLKFHWFINFRNYGVDSIFEVNASEIYQAEPPYNFLNSSSYTTAEGMNNTSVTTLKDNKLQYVELDNDKIIKLENTNIKYKLNDIVTFEALAIKDELKVGDIYYTKSLDNNELNSEKNTILEINNVTIDGVSQKYYKIEYIMIVDVEESTNIFYGNAEKIISFNIDLGDGFIINLRLESKNKATDLSHIADLYILNSIHLDESIYNSPNLGISLNINFNKK